MARILYHIPYPHGIGADRWIYEGWKAGFEAVGHDFFILQRGEDIRTRAGEVRPDVFFTAINIIDPHNASNALQEMRARGTKVFLWVHWPLEHGVHPAAAEMLRRYDVADVYFGEREPEQMGAFAQETGKAYQVIPHAAHPGWHLPTARVARYAYDVVYLGANLRKKRWFARRVLEPLRKRYRVGVFGPGWTLGDHVLRAGSGGLRKARVHRLAGWIDRRRLTIPAAEENALYSSAKIALNFHEREDDGSQPHYIVNQRTFKIPACGGFQICDDVPAIRKYFTEREVVLAGLDAGEWLETIDYYLVHDREREEIRAAGTRRAQRDHLYTHRVALALRLAGLTAHA